MPKTINTFTFSSFKHTYIENLAGHKKSLKISHREGGGGGWSEAVYYDTVLFTE